MDWVIIQSAQFAFSRQLQNNDGSWPRQHTTHSYPNRKPETGQQQSQRGPSSRRTGLVRHIFSWSTEVKPSPNSLCSSCVHVLSSERHDVPFQTSLFRSQFVPFPYLIDVIYLLRSHVRGHTYFVLTNNPWENNNKKVCMDMGDMLVG